MQLHIYREGESRWVFCPKEDAEAIISFYKSAGYQVEIEA